MSVSYTEEEIHEALMLRNYIRSLFAAKPDLPEVDIDKVHGEVGSRTYFVENIKRFSRTVRNSHILTCPSCDKDCRFLYCEALTYIQCEHCAVDKKKSFAAMGRLQELMGRYDELRICREKGGLFRVYTGLPHIDIKSEWGKTVVEAILNIKIDKGESND